MSSADLEPGSECRASEATLAVSSGTRRPRAGSAVDEDLPEAIEDAESEFWQVIRETVEAKEAQNLDAPSFLTRLRRATPLRQLRGALAAVRVEVSKPHLVEDLIERLRSNRCIVVRTGARTLEIRFGWPVRDDASQYELDGYLRVWEAMHPGTHATRVG